MHQLFNNKTLIKNQLLIIFSIIGYSFLILHLLRNVLCLWGPHILQLDYINSEIIFINMIFAISTLFIPLYFSKFCVKLISCLSIANLIYYSLFSYIYNNYVFSKTVIIQFTIPIVMIILTALCHLLLTKQKHHFWGWILITTSFILINFIVKYIDLNILPYTSYLGLPRYLILMIFLQKLQAVVISISLFYELRNHPRFIHNQKSLVLVLLPVTICL